MNTGHISRLLWIPLFAMIPDAAAADPIQLSPGVSSATVYSRPVGVSEPCPGRYPCDTAVGRDVNVALRTPAGVASAQSRNNKVAPHTVTASGTATVTNENSGELAAEARFFIGMDVSAPTRFSLTVNVLGGAPGTDPGVIGGVELFLRGAGEGHDIFPRQVLQAGLFTWEGILPAEPGAYGLTVISIARGGKSVSTGFDLTFAAGPDVDPVPEPASMILLGTGLAAVLGACRRRRA